MTAGPRRFTRAHPCPICGGHDGLARGQGVRCFGYLDASGDYARCTREDRSGSLRQNRDGTYSHRLHGPCRCGQAHGDPVISDDDARPKGRRRSSLQAFRSYFTLAAFLRRLYGEGSSVTPWACHDAEGREAFRVLRIDHLDADGTKAKTYRPCHQAEDGRWRLSKPGGLLPLYRLPAVLAVPPGGIVAVLEGEKCADLGAGLGLAHATTSAHGAKAPWLSDWSPLAGRQVAILSDEDNDGADYAAKVAALLVALDPPAEVRVVRLEGLSDGEDIEQWAARRREEGRADASVQAELLALVAGAFA
jgi:uncharacterized repeat protein (TIGR04076 family)